MHDGLTGIAVPWYDLRPVPYDGILELVDEVQMKCEDYDVRRSAVIILSVA